MWIQFLKHYNGLQERSVYLLVFQTRFNYCNWQLPTTKRKNWVWFRSVVIYGLLWTSLLMSLLIVHFCYNSLISYLKHCSSKWVWRTGHNVRTANTVTWHFVCYPSASIFQLPSLSNKNCLHAQHVFCHDKIQNTNENLWLGHNLSVPQVAHRQRCDEVLAVSKYAFLHL